MSGNFKIWIFEYSDIQIISGIRMMLTGFKYYFLYPNIRLRLWMSSCHNMVHLCLLVTLLSFKPNTHRRRDETVESRRVGVGGVYMNSRRLQTDSAM